MVPPKIKHLKINFRFLALILLVTLGGLLVYQIRTVQDNIKFVVNQEISRVIEIVAFEQEGWITRANQLLQVLAQSDEIKRGDERECSALLSKVNKIYPRYANFGLANLDGDIVCSALPFAPSVNIKDRLYFKRALLEEKFAVGEYQVGRITKISSINFGLPIKDEAGEIKYVIFAALDLKWIRSLLDRIDLPPDAILTVIDEKGIILARNQEPEKWIGKRLSEEDLLQEVLLSKTGVIEGEDIGGEKWLFAFTSLLGGDGVFAILALPAKLISAVTKQFIWQNILQLATALAAVLVVFWGFRKRK